MPSAGDLSAPVNTVCRENSRVQNPGLRSHRQIILVLYRTPSLQLSLPPTIPGKLSPMCRSTHRLATAVAGDFSITQSGISTTLPYSTNSTTADPKPAFSPAVACVPMARRRASNAERGAERSNSVQATTA